MRLNKLAVKGVTRFERDVVLDLAQLGPGLIAVIGANGEGKTTLMEATPALLYGSFPSRPGHLTAHAHGPDAYIEATFTHDNGFQTRELKARVLIDADKRRLEPYLFELDGAGKWTTLTSGRAAEYKLEIQRRFGSEGLFLASVFAAQDKAGNFLGLKRTARMELFAELLHLGYIQELQVLAKGHLDKELERLALVVNRIGDLERDLEGRPDLEKRLELAQLQVDADTQLVEEREAKLEEDLVALDRAKTALKSIETFDKAAIEAVAGAEEGRKRVERAGGLVGRLEARKAKLPDKIENVTGAANRELERFTREKDELETRPKATVPQTVGLAQVEEELATQILEKNRLLEVRRAYDIQEAERDAATRTADLLDEAPCVKSPMWARVVEGEGQRIEDLAGTCPLLEEAQKANKLLGTAATIDDPVEDLDAVIRRVDELNAWRDELKANEGIDRLIADNKLQAEGVTKRLEAFLQETEEEARTINEELAAAILERDLAVGDTQELERKRDTAVAQRETQVAFIGAQPVGKLESSIIVAREEIRTAKARLARGELAKLQVLLQQLEDKARDLQVSQDERTGAQREVKAWKLIEEALGRDGIQALEIDAAGPEVASLTNELLRACYGARFSISFETLRAKRTGGFSEAFDVKVYDGGQERAAEAISGGEKVIISEAVGLAIAIFNARKSGIQWRTLWRDETAGALWPETAQAYVAMLRRARELGGFDQVLFVSHQPEVWEAADVQARVAGGEVRLS
jgi:exonuclease SbcC